jgi:hypothetical protein
MKNPETLATLGIKRPKTKSNKQTYTQQRKLKRREILTPQKHRE